VIHRSPEINHLAVELHVHLVEMPIPVAEPAHPAHSLATDVACKHRAESIPPEANGLVAYIDAALEQQVFNVAQRQWERGGSPRAMS
jgi:hypothetical protein